MGTAERLFVDDALKGLKLSAGREGNGRMESQDVVENYGALTFNKRAMAKHMSKAVYR